MLPVDRGHEERVIRDVFAGIMARERAARLLDVYGRWRPDVVVRDEVDFGATVAAERLGIRHASFVVLAAGGLIRPDLVGEPLDALRAEYALPADPQLEMLHRHLTLVPVPPTYRTPGDPLPATARHIRPAVLDSTPMRAQHDASGTLVLDWLRGRSGRPTVYFTLGTVFHQESGDLFSRVVAGLRELDANIIVTVGREIDPAELGHQPANVRVDRFVRQDGSRQDPWPHRRRECWPHESVVRRVNALLEERLHFINEGGHLLARVESNAGLDVPTVGFGGLPQSHGELDVTVVNRCESQIIFE